jgi:hypothetical protein
MLERESRETGEQTFLKALRSESAPVRGKGELHSPDADKADRPRSPARRNQLSVAAEGRYGRAASDGLGAVSYVYLPGQTTVFRYIYKDRRLTLDNSMESPARLSCMVRKGPLRSQ